jgi:hypothetical protein
MFFHEANYPIGYPIGAQPDQPTQRSAAIEKLNRLGRKAFAMVCHISG